MNRATKLSETIVPATSPQQPQCQQPQGKSEWSAPTMLVLDSVETFSKPNTWATEASPGTGS